MSSKIPIRVAIIGGSFCGCALANGLLRYENVVFDVFESKPSFAERGAGVTLTSNAHDALRAMGLDAAQMLRDAGAVLTDGARCIAALGEHKGKTLVNLPPGSHTVARIEWLEQLLQNLPAERLHVNKKLARIEYPDGREEEGPCLLHFDDASTHHADVVIGCDGIRSTVRKAVLADHSLDLVAPAFGGYWDARGMTTPEEAAARFGTDLFDPLGPVSKVGLVGDGAFMLFSPRDNGKNYGVLLSAVAGPDYDSTVWKPQLTREFLEKTYKNWDESFRNAVIDCMFDDETGPGVMFSQWELPEAPTYCRGRVCIMGDAAHAMLPYMGSGAGMAIEDAAVMANLLGAASAPSHVNAVLKAFDHVRRNRCEFLIRTVHDAARLLTGQMGTDPAKLAPRQVDKWWEYLSDFDMDAHIQEAFKRYRIFQGID